MSDALAGVPSEPWRACMHGFRARARFWDSRGAHSGACDGCARLVLDTLGSSGSAHDAADGGATTQTKQAGDAASGASGASDGAVGAASDTSV